MAIDARHKRMSALNVSAPWRGALVLATLVGFSGGDRQAAAYMYSGITSGVAATTVQAEFTSFGTGTVVGVGASILTRVASSVGVATVQGFTSALVKSDFSSNGNAVAAFVGGFAPQIVQTEFSSAGVANVSGATAVGKATQFSSAGSASVQGITGVLAKSVFGSNGNASVAAQGENAALTGTGGAGSRYVISMRRRRRDVSNV